MRQWLGYDPWTGTNSYVDYDEATDTFRYVQEADPAILLEWNKLLYNEAPDRYGDGANVASVHPLIRMELERQGIWQDDKARRRWLNDSDNRGWRIRPGRV